MPTPGFDINDLKRRMQGASQTLKHELGGLRTGRAAAHRYLAEGKIVLLGGGTGNPFFTTDTTAVLRAAEIGAQAVLKATNVDGVYSADPKKDPSAKRFDRLTHSQAIEGGYKVMDATAFALARETSLPIIVFSIAEPGSIGAILRGTGHGTIVAG